MKKIILLIQILSFSVFADPGDGTLPPLKTLGVVIDNGLSKECRVFQIETDKLKVFEKKLQFKELTQVLKILPGKKGVNLEIKTPKTPLEKLENVLANEDEIITILTPKQKIVESLILTNSKEAINQFIKNSGC